MFRMSYMQRDKRMAIAALMVFSFTAVAAAQQRPQEVNRDNDHSWKIDIAGLATVTFVAGPAGCSTVGAGVNPPSPGPPLGVGSLRLESMDGVSGAQLRNTRYHRTYLADLVALDYWTCAFATENNGQQWPYIILNIDTNGDQVTDDLLFFEPAYQNSLNGNPLPAALGGCPDQGLQLYDLWQPWNARDGCWWSLNHLEIASPGTGVQPLSKYVAAFPQATIVNSDGQHGGIRLVQGFGDPVRHVGYVDRFEIAIRKQIYSFEPPPQ